MKNTFRELLVVVVLLMTASLSMKAETQRDSTICAITSSVDLSQAICSESTVTLSVPNHYQRTFYWTPGGMSTNSITVHPYETTTYSVTVIDTVAGDTCFNSVQVRVRPRFNTDVRQVMLTCTNSDADNGRTAQLKASAEGAGEHYTYYWEEAFGNNWERLGPLHIAPNDPSLAIGLKAYRRYRVKITETDSCNCSQYHEFSTKAYPTPVIEFTCTPNDSVFIQNPDVTFAFENRSADSIHIDHFIWTFEHGLTSTQEEPTFTFVEARYTPDDHYQPTLTVYDDCGCDTTYAVDVYVLPVKLKVPNVFTPNGDGFNDTFVITLDDSSSSSGGGQNSGTRSGNNSNERPLNEYFKSTELVVFNRWGRIVYQSDDYQNDWDGGDLSDGTYFYVLKCKGLKEVVQYQGSVMIITKKR